MDRRPQKGVDERRSCNRGRTGNIGVGARASILPDVVGAREGWGDVASLCIPNCGGSTRLGQNDGIQAGQVVGAWDLAWAGMLVNVAHVLICISKPLWVVLMLVESAVLGVHLVGQEAVGAVEQVSVGAVEFDKVVMMVYLMTSPT